MTNKPLAHPERGHLVAFGLGRLQPNEATKIEEHLEECAVCCETMLDLNDDTFVELVRTSPEPAESAGSVDQEPVDQEPVDQDPVDREPGDQEPVAADNANPAATMLVEAVRSSGPTELPLQLQNHARYQIVELIGKGGMGDVYKAEHRLMNRPVAVKLINQGLVQNGQAIERFRREVQTAARLSHPNIVTAHDAEQAGDVHFLVMEFVDGTDLATVVEQRGPLPIVEACDYIRQAADGLQHAHEQGMVHRDIKPHNLMLSPDNQVRILDFGLAGFATESALMEADSTGVANGDVKPLHLTTIGSVMGTPDFIAPEQAVDAHSADIRADIYSLGCTLYFLLSGNPPFKANSVLDKLKAHAEQQPPELADIRGDLPTELQEVLDRLLAKDPTDRFQTPSEVANALTEFVDRFRADGAAPVDQFDQPEHKSPLPALLPLYVSGTLSTVAFALSLQSWFLAAPGWVILLVRIGGLVSLPLGITILLFTDRSERRRSLNSALTAAKLSLLPLNPFALAMLPICYWSLTTLRHPTARGTFESGSRSYSKRWPMVIAITLSLLIVLVPASAVFYAQLGKTTIKFEIEDPSLTVRFGKDKISVDNDGQTIAITAGEKQKFVVEQNGLELETDSFILRKGEKIVLRVALVNGNVAVVPKGTDAVIGRNPVTADMEFSAGNGKRNPAVAGLTDFDRLQGTWKCTDGVNGSKPLLKNEIAAMSLWFDHDLIEIRSFGGRPTKLKYAISQWREPKWIEFINPDKTSNERLFAGIYAIVGDTLRIAFDEADRPRLRDFKPTDTPDHFVGTFRRVSVEEVNPETSVQPKPAVPAPPAADQATRNLVIDPSLEDTAENTALGKTFPPGWGNHNAVPKGSYRFELVEGGRTGKKGWLIEGDGQYITLPTNRVAITPGRRYVGRGWVKLSGSGSSAQLRLLYFDKSRTYIGETRLDHVNSSDQWQTVSILDGIQDYPKTHYVSLALSVMGNGKAVFDDLELLALPPELQVLDRLVGEWDVVRREQIPGSSAKRETSGTIRARWVISYSCVLGEVADENGVVTELWLKDYDVHAKVYRNWTFRSDGTHNHSEQSWNEATRSLSLPDEQLPETNQIRTISTQFTGTDLFKTRVILKDRSRTATTVSEDIATRRKGEALSLKLESMGPVVRSSQSEVLGQLVGNWSLNASFQPAPWHPNGLEAAGHFARLQWILGGRFVLEQSWDENDKQLGMGLWTFDEQEGVWFLWNFQLEGNHARARGQWDDPSKTLDLEVMDLTQGTTGRGAIRFIRSNKIDSTLVFRDRDGAVLMDGRWIRTRRDAKPDSQR